MRHHRGLASLSLLLAGCYTGLGANGGIAEDDGENTNAVASEGTSASGPESGTSGDDGAPAACAEPPAGVSPLRRLGRRQYANTIRDLLGIDPAAAASFPADDRMGPFTSNAISHVGSLHYEGYVRAAEEVAAGATADPATLWPCDVANEGETACGQGFVAVFARRAYRRPPTADETAALATLFESGVASGGYGDGLRLVIEAVLQSPHFLYHVELGQGSADDCGAKQLTDHELANRLSYFLWDTMPDDVLASAADAGELTDPDQLAAQVDRMLDDDRANAGLARFHAELLGVDMIDAVFKDPNVFPSDVYDPGVAAAMRAEVVQFAEDVIRRNDGRLHTLFTASYTLSDDPRILALYGASLPADHVAGAAIPLPEGQRAGLLTRLAPMTRHAHPDQSSPVHRGKLVRENFFCQPLPPPPVDVNNAPPPPSPDSTTRQRLEKHRENPACAACHDLIDPPGLTFEHYDGVGRWREMDGVFPVDASADLTNTDIDGHVEDAVALSEAMADSETVAACLARQWYRFALGRMDDAGDAIATADVFAGFTASDFEIRGLIRAVVLSDAFAIVRPAGLAPAATDTRNR